MIPEKNNFYATFEHIEISTVKEALERAGWVSRRVSEIDIDLKNDWSDLLLQDDKPNSLISGAIIIGERSLQLLDSVFKTLNTTFKYELYDDNENILVEKEFRV